MTNKMKTTAPVSSVGADGEQPNNKSHKQIIANETAKNNLQAINCPEKSGQGGGLQTISMTELYDTRVFDSLIIEKVLAGLIKPAFFMSNLLFYYIVFYRNVW